MPTRRLSGTASAASEPDNGGDNSGGGGSGGGYVDDVFSTYVYEGVDADQDIVNGIDLDGEGGMVWIKNRSSQSDHALFDTERGPNRILFSNQDLLEQDRTAEDDHLSQFNADGFTVKRYVGNRTNQPGEDFVSWTFRKAPSFFDIITTTISSGPSPTFTATSTGTLNPDGTITIPHSLKCIPGMIWMKVTDGETGKWWVQHKDVSGKLILNEPGAATPTANLDNITDTSFDIVSSGFMGQNKDNHTFVIYVFAHDDSEESMIQCGSGSGNGHVELGFEPQWILTKSVNTSYNWIVVDNMRELKAEGGYSNYLNPNLKEIERAGIDHSISPTGFYNGTYGGDFVYMAIRRPNKPASELEATDVFGIKAITATTDNEQIETGNLVDLGWQYLNEDGAKFFTRLLGEGQLNPASDSAINTGAKSKFDHMDGFEPWYASNIGPYNPKIAYGFKRQPGFFDVVSYKGSGAAAVSHNLGVVPEMMWVKDTNPGASPRGNWNVYHKDLGAEHSVFINETKPSTLVSSALGLWNNKEPTDSVFYTGYTSEGYQTGSLNQPYIAYLWASVPGICDIGTYTGTGNHLEIDCGFTNGARFVLVKRTNGGGGDWYVHDAVLGINVGDARVYYLNQKLVTQDYNLMDPYSGGFALTATALNWINVSGAEYIYMAIA